MPDLAFLGYDESQTRLIEVIRGHGLSVMQIVDPVTDLSGFDHVVSFGYRHILRADVLGTARRPIMNLHISFLPYNRGAQPNFWAWVEGTPHGVTLHEIAAGVDTGPILAQRRVDFGDDRITLRDSQARLIAEIEALFEEVLPDWLAGRLAATPQVGKGTYHAKKDLPDWLISWDIQAREAIARYAKSE